MANSHTFAVPGPYCQFFNWSGCLQGRLFVMHADQSRPTRPRTASTDPQIYARVIAAVLAEYPETVAMRVTDPCSGFAQQA